MVLLELELVLLELELVLLELELVLLELELVPWYCVVLKLDLDSARRGTQQLTDRRGIGRPGFSRFKVRTCPTLFVCSVYTRAHVHVTGLLLDYMRAWRLSGESVGVRPIIWVGREYIHCTATASSMAASSCAHGK